MSLCNCFNRKMILQYLHHCRIQQLLSLWSPSGSYEGGLWILLHVCEEGPEVFCCNIHKLWNIFYKKMMTKCDQHFSLVLCVSGQHKSKSFIDMIQHEIIYIQDDSDRWAPLFYLCSLFPLSVPLGRLLCVSLQMCFVQITLTMAGLK